MIRLLHTLGHHLRRRPADIHWRHVEDADHRAELLTWDGQQIIAVPIGNTTVVKRGDRFLVPIRVAGLLAREAGINTEINLDAVALHERNRELEEALDEVRETNTIAARTIEAFRAFACGELAGDALIVELEAIAAEIAGDDRVQAAEQVEIAAADHPRVVGSVEIPVTVDAGSIDRALGREPEYYDRPVR